MHVNPYVEPDDVLSACTVFVFLFHLVFAVSRFRLYFVCICEVWISLFCFSGMIIMESSQLAVLNVFVFISELVVALFSGCHVFVHM